MSCVVYTCHHVVELAPGQAEPGTVDIRVFVRRLDWLQRLGIRFIPMKDLRAWLMHQKGIPRRSAVMTFDDAYASVYEYAFPILKQRSIPFTVFVIAGLIGSKSHFYADRGGSERRHLNHAQLLALIESGQVEVGAHGYRHLDLTRSDDTDLAQELGRAKDVLEKSLNVEVPYLAYPYGSTTDAVQQKARQAGYQLAFTTQKMKLASAGVDPYAIPRVNWSRRTNLFRLSKYYWIPWLGSVH